MMNETYKENFDFAFELEKVFDFGAASRHYVIAAELAEPGSEDEVRALMRAATCMERQQNWRFHAAIWEKIGQRRGELPSPWLPGQSGMFHLIPYSEWEIPFADHIIHLQSSANGHQGDTLAISEDDVKEARRRQQRAWAYQWAAQGAQYELRFGYARNLYRKAGLSFMDSAELTIWQSRPFLQARLYETAGWCFFKAAWCNWQPGSLELPGLGNPERASVDRYNVPWTRNEIFKYDCGDDKQKTDVERMQDSYLKFGEARGSVALAYDHIAYQLSELQALLRLTGDRRQSRKIYMMTRSYERRADAAELRNLGVEERLFPAGPSVSVAQRAAHLSFRLPASYIAWVLTGNGTNVVRTLLSLLTLYCIVFPIAYFYVMVPSPGFKVDSTPRWLDALILSLLNTVSLSPNRFDVESAIGNLLQAAQGWSAFVALGYLLWILTRNFDS